MLVLSFLFVFGLLSGEKFKLNFKSVKWVGKAVRIV
jgi:hypothetical protein